MFLEDQKLPSQMQAIQKKNKKREKTRKTTNHIKENRKQENTNNKNTNTPTEMSQPEFSRSLEFRVYCFAPFLFLVFYFVFCCTAGIWLEGLLSLKKVRKMSSGKILRCIECPSQSATLLQLQSFYIFETYRGLFGATPSTEFTTKVDLGGWA